MSHSMRLWFGAALLALSASSPPVVGAKSLEDQLNEILMRQGTITESESLAGVVGVNTLASTAPFILERLAARATDFPAPPTSAGFTFEYNPELGIFEKASSSLGPVFAERAETVGRQRLNLSVNYLHAVVDELDGEKVNGDPSKSGLADVFSGFGFAQPASDVDGDGKGDFTITRLNFSKFELVYDVARFTATYGLMQNWDLNILVPLISTTVNLEGTRSLRYFLSTRPGQLDAPAEFCPKTIGRLGLQCNRRFSLNANAVGVGDVLLRTKHRLGTELKGFKFAGVLTLRAPSGEEKDFQGFGDWVITPLFVASRADGLNDYHANLGMEVNADGLERSRVRYSVGATLQPTQRVAASIDVVGHSGVAKDRFDIVVSPAIRPASLLPGVEGFEQLPSNRTRIKLFVPRTDIVDLSGILKVNVFGNAIAYGGAIVPLTDDGLHASVIPVGGLEYTF